MLTANDHVRGALLSTGGLERVGSFAVTITAANNGRHRAHSIEQIPSVSPLRTPFLIENNGVGLHIEGGAGAQIVGGLLTVRNNETGLLADGAGT